MSYYHHTSMKKWPPRSRRTERLSRQRLANKAKTAELRSQGLSPEEIASQLGVEKQTVQTYIRELDGNKLKNI